MGGPRLLGMHAGLAWFAVAVVAAGVAVVLFALGASAAGVVVVGCWCAETVVRAAALRRTVRGVGG